MWSHWSRLRQLARSSRTTIDVINDDDIALLREVFPDWSDVAMMQAAQDCDVEFFPPGGTLIAEGAASDTVYAVADGLLRVSVGGTRAPVAYLARGQYIGKKAPDGEHLATVTAVRETRVIRMPGDTYRRLLA